MAAKPRLSCELEMTILSRVATKIGRYLELDKVLETTLEEVLPAIGVKSGCIYLTNEDTGNLTMKAHVGLTETFLNAKKTIRPGDGCAGTAVVTKEMFAPTKDERHFVCKEAKDFLGLDCLAAMPIVAQNKALGVLELFAPLARRLAADERELIEAINVQLSVAIKNASTYTSLQHALDNTKKLLQATETITATLEFNTILEHLAHLATELTLVSRASIALYRPKTKEIEFVVSPVPEVDKAVRRPIVGATLKRVYEKGQAVAVYNLDDIPEESRQPGDENSFQSILIVPLRFAGQTLGALYLDEPHKKHKFTPLQIELAEGIARHTATAIQNAKSFESTQRALTNAEGLLQAAEIVATISDPNILLNQLAKLIPRLTGISRSTICLYDAATNEFQIAIPPSQAMPKGTLCMLEGGPLNAVLRKGETIILEDGSRLPEPLQGLMQRDNVRSILITPLHYGSNIIGALMLFDTNNIRHEFTSEEIDLAEAVSHHAAIGVTNARSFSHQRLIAETLQQSFVPSRPPTVKDVTFGVGYRSASETAFVGGDFYDFLHLNGQLGLCIGDVSGQGIGAASLAGMAKSIIRAFAFEQSTPSQVLKRTNKVIAKQTTEQQFITLFYGVLDLGNRNIKYANAGHPPPLLIHKVVDFLPMPGQLPIGVYDTTKYQQQTVSLPKRGCLLLYTDGLIEARSGSRLFGMENLAKIAYKYRNQEPQRLVDSVLSEVELFSGHALTDDIAIVAIKL